MKRCPTCQQTYPDNAPDFCPRDGTRMTADAAASPPQYAQGAGYQQPYGSPPPPPQNWSPGGGGGYYPQAGHAPQPARAAAGGGLGKISMLLGLVSLLLTAFFFTIVGMIRSGNFDLLDFAQPAYYAMVGTGIVSILLGIVALVKPGGGKGKAIIGICTSLPAILFFIYVIATTGQIV